MPTRVRSHAKINLGLGVGAPRPDGYHALSTVYQTIEPFDVVTVAARRTPETTLRLTSNDARVPCDSTNTAWKMVALALETLCITAEVEIHIEKFLPVQGGMGAGSANAVAALVGLEREFNIPSTANWKARRLEIGAKVGSDVPLFLIGGTVLGIDRGQLVAPLPDLAPVWCVIVAPEIGVSTPQAFRDWDALCAAQGLTHEASTDKLNRLSRAYMSAFGVRPSQDGPGSSGVLAQANEFGIEDLAGPQVSELVRTGITNWIQNDFEQVVFRQYPSLAEIKLILAAADKPGAALHASLSGSGSALFGLYQTRGEAQAAVDRLNRQDLKARITLTRTLPRDDYWHKMILD